MYNESVCNEHYRFSTCLQRNYRDKLKYGTTSVINWLCVSSSLGPCSSIQRDIAPPQTCKETGRLKKICCERPEKCHPLSVRDTIAWGYFFVPSGPG